MSNRTLTFPKFLNFLILKPYLNSRYNASQISKRSTFHPPAPPQAPQLPSTVQNLEKL